MKKIGICGHLDREVSGENGQTMKTVMVSEELKKEYGENEVSEISTHIWKKKPVTLVFKIAKLAMTCRNIIVFPDANGVKVILPMFYVLSKFFGNNIIYSVQGAWLPDVLSSHKLIKRVAAKISVLLVETKTLENKLNEIGINNTVIFKNFKNLQKVNSVSIEDYHNTELKVCYFSRIDEKKGIFDAVRIIKKYNKNNSRKIKFDIYGYGPDEFVSKLEMLIDDDENIKYFGQINAMKAVEIISKYHYQIFPTRYKTEGIPGSIIDSFFSGTPVIASKWDSVNDVLEDGYNSIMYEFCDLEDFYVKLSNAYQCNYDDYLDIRKNALISAEAYIPNECINVLKNHIK